MGRSCLPCHLLEESIAIEVDSRLEWQSPAPQSDTIHEGEVSQGVETVTETEDFENISDGSDTDSWENIDHSPSSDHPSGIP